MRLVVYIMILSVLLAEYLTDHFSLPRPIAWLPESVSLFAALIVIVRGIQNRFKDVDARYLIVFGLLLLHITAGVILNHLSPGVVFAGIRTYLKSLPFFFLPLVARVEDRDLKRQLLLIAGICLIQLPIAWDQRMATEARGGYTGDGTTGTLGISSFLSIFLCGAVSVAMAFYLKGKLSLKALIVFLALTLPATMINETKGTLLLLPVALLAPVLFLGQGGESKLKRGALTIVLIGVFIAAFIPVYDHFAKPGLRILEFLQMEGRVERYLVKDSEIGSEKSGKIDSLLLPFKASRHDPIQVTFGLGIGNVSPSIFGHGFAGEHFGRYGHLVLTSISLLLWEVGVLGTALVFCLFYLIFRDTLFARDSSGSTGALALGWIGVVGVVFIAMFYKTTINSNALSYLFWLYSGVVAAASMRVRHAAVVSDVTPRPSGSQRHAAVSAGGRQHPTAQ
ncbi:MAG: hypothetical protein L0387_45715 [Acidobacteria bacterium]|nr:hypothetical protein [Acidobacteriota bacterium]